MDFRKKQRLKQFSNNLPKLAFVSVLAGIGVLKAWVQLLKTPADRQNLMLEVDTHANTFEETAEALGFDRHQ